MTNKELHELAENALIFEEFNGINIPSPMPTHKFKAACEPERIIALVDENERLRKALEFYADEPSWFARDVAFPCCAASDAEQDGGAKAREALEAQK